MTTRAPKATAVRRRTRPTDRSETVFAFFKPLPVPHSPNPHRIVESWGYLPTNFGTSEKVARWHTSQYSEHVRRLLHDCLLLARKHDASLIGSGFASRGATLGDCAAIAAHDTWVTMSGARHQMLRDSHVYFIARVLRHYDFEAGCSATVSPQ